MTQIQKVWGFEEIIVNEEYCGKRMFLRQGFSCSLHFHPIKDETFYILSGCMALEFEIDELREVVLLKAGESFRLEPNTSHRFYGVEDTIFFEFSTHDEPSDSIRIEPSSKGASVATEAFLKGKS